MVVVVQLSCAHCRGHTGICKCRRITSSTCVQIVCSHASILSTVVRSSLGTECNSQKDLWYSCGKPQCTLEFVPCMDMACGCLASSPGLLIGGRGGEGLVSTACACAMFSMYFTVKVSVNVYRQYPYIIGLFKI